MFATTRKIDIGWCTAQQTGAFAFAPPRTVMSTRERALGLRAVQNCPAVNALERQLVELPSPFGLRLRLEAEPDGPALSVDPLGTFVQPEVLGAALTLEPAARWRDPGRPVIQLRLPFFFVTDESPCTVTLLPPFLGPAMRRWPGSMIGARFALDAWPRDLVFAFEWDQPGGELHLRQGEALAYAMFEFDAPDKRPNLVEAELTPELAEFRLGLQGVGEITPDMDGVLAEARARRPARLLTPGPA